MRRKLVVIGLLAALVSAAGAQIQSTERTRAWRAAVHSDRGEDAVIRAGCRHTKIFCAGRWRCRGKACPDARGRWQMVLAKVGPRGAYPDPIVLRSRHLYCTVSGANPDGPPFTMRYECFALHADGTPIIVLDQSGNVVPVEAGTITLAPARSPAQR